MVSPNGYCIIKTMQEHITAKPQKASCPNKEKSSEPTSSFLISNEPEPQVGRLSLHRVLIW
jgi:hypothetical protein